MILVLVVCLLWGVVLATVFDAFWQMLDQLAVLNGRWNETMVMDNRAKILADSRSIYSMENTT